MTTIHGFEIIETREIPELNTKGTLYRHAATGAELLSLENDDENKVFGIVFRTPPPDSTGLPHIMEHSVLGGSRKYPVKEPFVELIKGSLKTFVNAFTYPDKTCYPVASQNLQDFYNLIDVYLDAVFYPNITPETLQQEGWHYEIEEPDAPLVYKGIVFNEMKGAYSSPDALVGRFSESLLFPDTAYSHDYGGDPTAIPNLTYAQFKAFHDRYYHPANARIFFYGNDDPEERLRIVEAYLKDFGPSEVDSGVTLQPPANAPWRETRPYPVSADEEAPKAFVTVNWLLPENADPTQTLALAMLSHILVGIPASPLRKALIDSGLGEDVIGGGLDDTLRQLYFSTGLKGVAEADVDKIEPLILETLADLVKTGIDPAMVEAAVNTIEFRLREQNFGAFPRGIAVMLNALSTWLHDRDPWSGIAFEAPLNAIKAGLAADPAYFEHLIQKTLLDNTHRMTFVLEPDRELARRMEADERARLDAARAKMTAGDIQALIEATRRLKKRQETPDSPEALATIPTLTLDDLDKKSKIVPTEILAEDGTRVLYHDLFTNGIVYLDAGFDLHVLPQDLLPYAAIFSTALLAIGTEDEDFVRLTQRIGRKTGGISPALFTSARRDADGGTAWLFLRGKATVGQTGDLLDILRDILLTVKLDNKPRFMQMLLEQKAREEAMLIPNGHRVVMSRLRAKFNEADWAGEQTSGIDYLFFLRELIAQTERDWPAVLEKLEAVRRILVNRNAMLCNVTVDSDNWTAVRPQLRDFLAALPATPAEQQSWSPAYVEQPEGLTIPAQVNYVAKGANLYDLGYVRNGAIEVITHYLRSTWLWERVRVQGGAYGGFCVFDQYSGIFSYLSYRDPNLIETLDNYDGTGTFLRTLDLSKDELVKGIIGTIGNIDAYQLPDAKGYSALARYLIGYTDEARQQYRDEVLATTIADFHTLADVLDRLGAAGRIVVLGSAEAVGKAKETGKVDFSVTKVL